MFENSLTIMFLSNTTPTYICENEEDKINVYINMPQEYFYVSISAKAIVTINPFKQPKCALQLKLLNFKNFANCKIFIYLPDHNNRSTT